MENEKTNNPGTGENWFDEILGTQEPSQPELGLDESAVYSAGLIHPADMELEKIIQEAKAMDSTAPVPTAAAPEAAAEPQEPTAMDPHFHTPDSLEEEPFRDEEYREVFGQGQELNAIFGDEAPSAPAEEQAGGDVPVFPADIPEAAIEVQPPAAEQEPELESQLEQPAKKRRPRRKKGDGLFGIPHILSTAIWALIILAVGISLGRLVWVCAADVLAFGKPAKTAVITIRSDDSIEEIASKLEKAGLIEYPDLFVMYMKFSGNDKLQTGSIQLKSMIYDYHAIKTALSPKVASRDVVEVVIPEGYTCAQIFQLLEEKGVCSVVELEQFLESLDDPNSTNSLNEYWFLEGVELGDKYSLEGYLFPDTYQFYKSHDPELVLEKMLDNFDYRFTDIMKGKIDTLNETLAKKYAANGYNAAFIAERKVTVREVVIIASMIERETANGAESYDISAVIYNRLTKPGEFPYLNIDATVIYGLGGKIDPETGESIPLTMTDLQTDTPYNTYTRKGLIPGPISNPGRNSINAALDPEDNNYYYYVYDPDSHVHRFAATAAEHEYNKSQVGN